uniref:Putative secreted protein n=1 Tax=Anopheles marajoara TaxID=58244 RepID=A0A2M4CAI4_9DIPT
MKKKKWVVATPRSFSLLLLPSSLIRYSSSTEEQEEEESSKRNPTKFRRQVIAATAQSTKLTKRFQYLAERKIKFKIIIPRMHVCVSVEGVAFR